MADSVPADALNIGEQINSPSSTDFEPSLSRHLKAARIETACNARSLPQLAELATSEKGLINDDFRRTAWPVLLGCRYDASSEKFSDWESLPNHTDEEQVKLDVDRAFVYYPNDESSNQLEKRKSDLQSLIVEVLRTHPKLCYFQGFHDIVQVFLLVLGRDNAPEAIARLSLLRIRDFMLPNLDPAIAHLRLLPAILQKADPDVAKHLSHTDPFFALSSTLTLYAHDIQEYGDIARLYDFLIAREAVVSIYLFATIIVSRKAELLEIEEDEPEMLHSILCKLPKTLNLDKWIEDCMTLFLSHPPESLLSSNWRWISSSSVLKTIRDPTSLAHQTLQDGERMFQIQDRQMRMLKQLKTAKSTIWARRRPMGAVGFAVAVAVVSYWLRRDGFSTLLLSGWYRIKIALFG